jgi:cell division protein ZapE
MSKLINVYKSDLQKLNLIYDHNQEKIIVELNELLEILENKNKQKDVIFFSDILNFFKKEEFLGLYIYGDVGRGKTYLVDLFFNNLSIEKKIRLHFYHFMKIVHEKLTEYVGKKNPLDLVAKWFNKKYMIICLDEFYVKDIGDAMNLSVLFYNLFNLGTYMVITSNVKPNRLYEGGLQRQKFIPTIFLIEKFMKIINIGGNIDYRYKTLKSENTYFYPHNFNNLKKVRDLYSKLSDSLIKKKIFIRINGRNILANYVSDSTIWFNCKIICGSGRSQMDYIEIATLFKIVFLSNLGLFNNKNEDEARRFISMIDEFYDRKINIIVLSEVNFDKLYIGELLNFDFQRTQSRLKEMSNFNYTIKKQ